MNPQENSSSLFDCIALRKFRSRKFSSEDGDDSEKRKSPETDPTEEINDDEIDGTVMRQNNAYQRQTSPRSTPDVQVEYKSHLVPRMNRIINCQFYWGKIDRYEAEQLLHGQDEGSFLLRDSVQDDYVFSVSFRRYNRTLHARVEESQHQFSFDCHDPGVHSSSDVRELLERYKNPSHCMFFEPMLVKPIMRKHVFSLQDLSRSVISDRLTYSSINQLPLPKALKGFLREYHYRHKVSTRQLD